MNLGLKGKVIFVAGSSRGIGRATAEAFLREGCRVVVSGRERGSLEETFLQLQTAYGSEVLSYCGDLEQSQHIVRALEQTMARWGQLDGVIANIGSGTDVTGWEVPEADWEKTLGSNLWGGERLVRLAVPFLMKSGSGSVILLASIAGLEDLGAPVSYTVAKSAVITVGKCLARRLGSHNIRVNIVAPGNVIFPGGRWAAKLDADAEGITRYIQQEVPLRRFGKPEEIADVVVFLCSDRARFVTGSCVVVDGGQTRAV